MQAYLYKIEPVRRKTYVLMKYAKTSEGFLDFQNYQAQLPI